MHKYAETCIESRKMNELVHTFRLATPDDAEALLKIYEPYIATTVTNETQVPALGEFRQRIVDRDGAYPYIVCEEDGRLVGYAYGSRLFSRAAYAWSAELSVYFSTDHRGRGLGRAIYGKLFDLLALQGVRTVVGKVVCPNEKSDHLHEKMGFELVGTLRAASWKLGAWHDVHLWEKHIGDVEVEPAPLLRLSEVDPEKVRAILEA